MTAAGKQLRIQTSRAVSRGGPVNVSATFSAKSWVSRKAWRDIAQSAAEQVMRSIKQPPHAPTTLTVAFASDKQVRELNARWRAIDRPTNVLSFPSPAVRTAPPHGHAAQHLGDLALGYETIAAEAACEGKTIQAHVTHLIAHGILHLLGYDHSNMGDARKMERIEVRILSLMGISNPYRPNPPKIQSK